MVNHPETRCQVRTWWLKAQLAYMCSFNIDFVVLYYYWYPWFCCRFWL